MAKLGPAADAATAAASGEDLPAKDLVVAEGVSGTFYYHLADSDLKTVALCGAKTMATDMSMASWGKTGHLGERWCSRCEVQAVARQRVTRKVQETKKRT